MKELIAYLKSKNIYYWIYDNFGSKYVVCNGYKIKAPKEGGYIITAIKGGRINKEPIITPEDVFYRITDITTEKTLHKRLLFILDSEDDWQINKRKSENLSKKEKYAWTRCRESIKGIISKSRAKIISKRIAASMIVSLLESEPTPLKNRLKYYQVTNDIVPVIRAIIPIPLDPSHLLTDSLTIEDFVIIETLTSFPFSIPAALRVSNGKPTAKAMLTLKTWGTYMRANSKLNKLAIPKNWLETINESPYKRNVYELCMNFLIRNHFKDLKTRNKKVWAQISVLYGSYNSAHLLTPEFMQKLNSFSLVKR